MVNKQKWVSYDNERSVKMKADLAWDKNLAGVMVWSIETDDFNGRLDISYWFCTNFAVLVLVIIRKRPNVSQFSQYSYKRRFKYVEMHV